MSMLSILAVVLVAQGTNDMTQVVMNAVERTKSSGEGTIEFAPGEYRFSSPQKRDWWISNHHDPMPRNVFLPIEGAQNLTLTSKGARFVCDGEGIALALVDSTNVTVRGIAFDYVRPYFSEWRLQDGKLTKLSDMFPYEVRDGKIWSVGRGWSELQRLAEFFDGTTRTFLGAKWWDGSVTATFPGFPDGAVVVTRNGWRPNPTVFLYRAMRSAFENCGVLSSAGIGLMAQRSETVTVRNWHTREGRYITSLQADATHFSNCRGEIMVCDSMFEGMVDDAINVHSTCLKIVEVRSPTRIVCRYMNEASIGFEVFLPGERLRFIKGLTLEPDAECRVKAVHMRAKDEAEIALAEAVPPGLGKGDAVENADWQPSVVFRGNTVRNSKPRAALFTTPGRVVCESNFFDHVAGSPIQLAGDVLDWFESGACRDVAIRGNVFRSCAKVGGRAMVLANPAVKDLTAQRARYHRNIRIEDNRFEDFTVPLVQGWSVSNLVLRGNAVVHGNGEIRLTHSEAISPQ